MSAVELAYEQYGEQQSACPLMILHGFFASSRNWRTIAKALAVQRPVFVLDMRNHGASPHAPLMDYPSMAADLDLFMHRHKLESTHMLGHSMGGKAAMLYALQNPQRVEKLLIGDIAPVSYRHSFDQLINALIDLPLQDLSNRKQADTWLEPRIPDSNYRQFLLQNLEFLNNRYQWRINLEFFLRNAHFITGFPEIESIEPYPKPALFLAAEASTYLSADTVNYLFPYSSIIEIAGAGHWLQADAPQEFCRIVSDWLDN
jgi:esterase